MNSEQVLNRYDITYRMLDHWWTKGYLSVDGEPPKEIGRGRSRYYSVPEILILEAMLALVAAGMRPEPASRVARNAGDARHKLEKALEVARNVH